MTFEFIPILDLMIDLYEKPRTTERFHHYLAQLQGDTKGDLALPIMGFNPMAKAHVLHKMYELKALDIEGIIQHTLIDINSKKMLDNNRPNFKLCFNLLDDVKGGWTNRYTSDYDSKFKLSGLVNRNFCTPVFWASEAISKEIIVERTLEYIYRTICWLEKPHPTTLEEHVAQEIFVSKQLSVYPAPPERECRDLEQFYTAHQRSDQYNVIFNFFYGDEASDSLNFPSFGIKGACTGFDYAKWAALLQSCS